jgi:hypothetical protein
MILNIEQKKGDPKKLDGRLIVYAKLDLEPSEIISMKHPVASMINNGILAAQGNYKEQSNLRDFLKAEMGMNLEEGLESFLEKLDGLESTIDPEKLKEKLSNIEEIEDFIPTPAKIVSFFSEEEILAQEGDIFYTGIFKNIGNAILSVNSVPIIYQAIYREQEILRVRNEIELLIAQIEKNTPVLEKKSPPEINIEQKIIREFIPNMLYCRNDKKIFNIAEKQFRDFFNSYSNSEDINAIVSIISKEKELTAKHFKLLELYAKKIAKVIEENYNEAEKLQREISALSNE